MSPQIRVQSKRKALTALVAMMSLLVAVSAGAVLLPNADQLPSNTVLAGAAKVDSTWHVGASAGQYASDGTAAGSHGVDYTTHSTRRESSYGIQGREWVRALIVQGTNQKRFALVSNDLYIPQDLVNRRVTSLLAEYDKSVPANSRTGITPENLTISVSHSHSSPYYSTPSWGVWAFQDVFDIRFFEHVAQKMADAVILASKDLRPARVGAAISPFGLLKRHSFGTTIADDGTPGGYPKTDIDKDLTVVRVDDMTDPQAPAVLANWVVFGLHPEMLNGNDLLTGEFVNTTYRIVDRQLGGVTLFSQNDTGTAEPARGAEAHHPSARQEFSHKDYAQMERASRQLADAVIATSQDVVRGSFNQPLQVSQQVEALSSDFDVAVKDLRFAPPSFRALPSVSSCRAEKAFDGNPGIPIVGLPDCAFPLGNNVRNALPFDPGVTYDTLRNAGVPIPDNIGAPSYTGLQETTQVHLQAIKLGDIGITICPCEQWADQSRNIKSRLNKTEGDFWYGWDWTSNYTQSGWQPGHNYRNEVLGWCTQNANTTWTCKNPNNPSVNLPAVSNANFQRMKAQIYNDARGWDKSLLQGDSEENSLQAETDPTDVNKIWGNYTHEELSDFGFDMVITVGMSNDYWGYIATYREFQRGDHYRKALTGLGPHSSDFLATRLSRMAAELNGGPAVELSPKDRSYEWEYTHQGLRADALGKAVQTYLPAYEAALPSDAGMPRIVSQPADVQRFGAAKVSWVGGSNYVDSPRLTVERCNALLDSDCDPSNPARWDAYADGFGEIQVKANYPQPEDLPFVAGGQYEWNWDATFETFDSDIALPDLGGNLRTQTPSGTYRFVIEGCQRSSTPLNPPSPSCPAHDATGRVKAYSLASQPFRVSPWEGITASSLTYDGSSVSFAVGPNYPYAITSSNTERGPINYPNTYSSPFRFIRGGPNVINYAGGFQEVFCYTCTFRPWADTGSALSATVSVERAGGGVDQVPATFDASAGVWRAPVLLGPGDRAFIARGGIVDEFGEFNGIEYGSP